jgi:hypothetical protein
MGGSTDTLVSTREEAQAQPHVAPGHRLLCPSAPAESEGGVAFGVVGGTARAPRVGYLAQTVPVNADLLNLAGPVAPTEVFRFAAPCAEHACQHFDGERCGLARRIVQQLPEVVPALPVCRVRSECRWWQQEGRDACLRCPQVVTLVQHPSEAFRAAVAPTNLC